MTTCQLLRTDLPKKRISGNSLHIPVLLKGKKRFIVDIHFAKIELVFLENAKGIPTEIGMLKLITDGRSKVDIRKQIEGKQQRLLSLIEKQKKLQSEILQLSLESQFLQP